MALQVTVILVERGTTRLVFQKQALESVLPVFSETSLGEGHKVVLDNRNVSICTGTTA